jgi:hypothetical protein
LLKRLWDWIFADPLAIDHARIQWVVREERRAAMERELSGRDARSCMERVQRRMQDGDAVWIAPMHGRAAALEAWLRRHEIQRKVTRLEPKR